MATKKNTVDTESPEMKEKELVEALEAARKEKEELLKEVESLRKKNEPKAAPKPAAEYDAEYWNEKIPYEAFYDGDKYTDDISVVVNGQRFLIQRGKQVMVPRFVVHVLENQAKQMKYSADYNRSLQDDFERQTKKFLGE